MRFHAAPPFAVATFMPLFLGPSVEHPLAGALSDASTVLSGMVIALAFFTASLKKGEESAGHAPNDF